jgi:hypothetical protein
MFSSFTLCTQGPMKLIERADGLMRHAQVLYEQYESWMTPDDRTLAKDRITM